MHISILPIVVYVFKLGDIIVDWFWYLPQYNNNHWNALCSEKITTTKMESIYSRCRFRYTSFKITRHVSKGIFEIFVAYMVKAQKISWHFCPSLTLWLFFARYPVFTCTNQILSLQLLPCHLSQRSIAPLPI